MHLATLEQREKESNAGARRPVINVQSSKLARGCSDESLDKTFRKERCLRCSEWRHAVSRCPLSQAPVQSHLEKQRSALVFGKLAMSARSKHQAYQKFEKCGCP